MSMDDDQEDEDDGGMSQKPGHNDLLSPAAAVSMDSRPGLIHRRELDSQEALDLEEERRERELSGRLGQDVDQAAGPSAAPPQPGE